MKYPNLNMPVALKTNNTKPQYPLLRKGIALLLLSFGLVVVGNSQAIDTRYLEGNQKISIKNDRSFDEGSTYQHSDSSFYRYDEQNRLTSINYFWFNDSIWQHETRRIYTYPEAQLIVEKLQNKIEGSWKDKTISTKVIGDNGLLASRTRQFDEGQGLENSDRYLLEYDAHENLTLSLEQAWVHNDLTGGDWTNSYRFINAYTEDGLLLNEKSQSSTGILWQNEWATSYEYDSWGNLTQTLDTGWFDGEIDYQLRKVVTSNDSTNTIQENYAEWRGSQWVDYRIITTTLNEQNQPQTILTQSRWDGVLDNSSKNNYFYDDHQNLIQIITFQWENENWEALYTTDYIYDANHNLVKVLPEGTEFVYNAQNEIIKKIAFSNWVLEYSPWFALERTTTVYANSLSVNIVEPSKSNIEFTLFPNPTSDYLHVQLKNIAKYPIHANLYNVQGQLVKKIQLTAATQTVSLTQLPKGHYFVQLITSQGERTQSIQLH